MTTYNTSDFKPGLKIILESSPCSIIEAEFVKPGKGQAFTRVKYRNLKTGRVGEKTFRSGDNVESADVVEGEFQYLYNDGQFWHFMNMASYEQVMSVETAVAEAKLWLREQDVCSITLWNGEPLLVMPPNSVVLKVVETDPGMKGDTATGGTKPAEMETGAIVKVPLFIQVGELIKVNTRTGEYISRAKES